METDLTLDVEMPKKVEATSEFGRRLVEIRKARGLTQAQLAKAVSSSQRAISHYETIADFPPAAVIVQLARALDVSTDELLGFERASAVAESGLETPETRRLWRKFQRVAALPEKDRRAVIRLINSLVAAASASPSASWTRGRGAEGGKKAS